jgi:hypothetical protein
MVKPPLCKNQHASAADGLAVALSLQKTAVDWRERHHRALNLWDNHYREIQQT